MTKCKAANNISRHFLHSHSARGGGDLYSRISEDPLPEQEALHIMRQILQAVNFMHDRSIMHLDLKVCCLLYGVGPGLYAVQLSSSIHPFAPLF